MAKDNYTLAREVLKGLWGNGLDRRSRLEAAGYDYMAVQTIVNALVNDASAPREDTTVEQIEITQERTLEVDMDLSKYDAIKINIKGAAQT